MTREMRVVPECIAEMRADMRADVCLSVHRDLLEAEREWRALEQRADCTVFQSFGWLSAWQLHIGTRVGARPVIVIGRDSQGETLFLLPLSVEPGGLARRLTWLGSETSDYNAPLLAQDLVRKLDPRQWRLLWDEILRRIQTDPQLRFDVVHLIRMPETLGTQRNPFCDLPVTLHPSGVYLTHLHGDWATFYANKRSASTRQRDRTKRNRLGKFGDVRLVTPTTAEDVASSFATLVLQKTRSFAAMGVANIFSRPGYAEFYGSLPMGATTRHIAHLSRLDVGAIPAAINLGLTFRGRYYHILASFEDGEVSRFGPGAAHLHELMRHAIETGCDVFDFTVGDERYKLDWADTQAGLFDHISAASWRGAIVAPLLLAGTCVKRFIKQTPIVWSAFNKVRRLIR